MAPTITDYTPTENLPSYVDASEAHAIAQEIRRQIGPLVLMSLGASDFSYSAAERGTLIFKARILPFKANGERSERAAVMMVRVVLTAADTYTVSVVYRTRGELRLHMQREGVYCDEISRLMLALDYDGEEVLNPRYI